MSAIPTTYIGGTVNRVQPAAATLKGICFAGEETFESRCALIPSTTDEKNVTNTAVDRCIHITYISAI